jgi:hypothetical protein
VATLNLVELLVRSQRRRKSAAERSHIKSVRLALFDYGWQAGNTAISPTSCTAVVAVSGARRIACGVALSVTSAGSTTAESHVRRRSDYV